MIEQIEYKKYRFYKEDTNKWYADIPEWDGYKEDLEMVCGADTFLDIVSKGNNETTLKFSINKFENCSELILIREDINVGGGYYLLSDYNGIELNLEIWLCEVTRFVFGYIPKNIYIQKV